METLSEIGQLKAKLESAERALSLANAQYAELQHRVRNEFQVFLSFFAQRQRIAKPTDFCRPCISRMWSAVALHAQLDEPPFSICMLDYIKTLAQSFEHAFDGSIVFKTHIHSKVTLDNRQGQLLGQIFCEAAMNAVKHAFPNGEIGEVVTSLEREGDIFSFIISNDGADFDADKVPPNGFHAIRDLAIQLNGEVRAAALPKGMQVRVTFPSPTTKEGENPNLS